MTDHVDDALANVRAMTAGELADFLDELSGMASVEATWRNAPASWEWKQRGSASKSETPA